MTTTANLHETLADLKLTGNDDLAEQITEFIRDAIAQASRDEANWTWDDSESSCGGADICNPNARSGSMWCGTLDVDDLGMTIGYGFCVRWDGKRSVDISYDSGCRDGDLGEIEVNDGIVYLLDMADLIDLRDICWQAGEDVSTPGLEDAVLAVTGVPYDYRDISDDGRTWINDLRECDSFPVIGSLTAMTSDERDALSAFLRAEDGSVSEEDMDFSRGVADEIDAL